MLALADQFARMDEDPILYDPDITKRPEYVLNLAKKNKDYSLADKIREELKEKNIVLKDTKEETLYEIVR